MKIYLWETGTSYEATEFDDRSGFLCYHATIEGCEEKAKGILRMRLAGPIRVIEITAEDLV